MEVESQLTLTAESPSARLYQSANPTTVKTYIATTPGTRAICNDPAVAGIRYTRLLQESCRDILKLNCWNLSENHTVVLNILRGGLNYGLRDALADAYGWNTIFSSFIGLQRMRDPEDPEAWSVNDFRYEQFCFPQTADVVVGDVVATGTSLKRALKMLLHQATEHGVTLRSLLLFTYGGNAATTLLEEFSHRAKKLFPEYRGSQIVFLEGCFTVPTPETPLQIKLTGTDLVRYRSLMAPEFLESQYEDPSYALERCTIYDAGSRAFSITEYALDVREYWEEVLALAIQGSTYSDMVKERFPELDTTRLGEVQLRELAERQIAKMNRFLTGKVE